jgi:hypothetical protein
VNSFPLDGRGSAVRLQVDLGCALTVLADGCYRGPGKRLQGFAKAKAKQPSRRFVATAGMGEVRDHRVLVHRARRNHNPVLREAAIDQGNHPVPWLGNRTVSFSYS